MNSFLSIKKHPPYACFFNFLSREWWKQDIVQVYNDFRRSGGDPVLSDAYTINGQPGDLYPCSNSETFKLNVRHGKTYLLRIVNAALEQVLFFGIANHKLTVEGTDGSYIKPAKVDYITISPGQTMDVLLEANQPIGRYYMAAKAYSSSANVPFNPSNTTAILQYKRSRYISTSPVPSMPLLPNSNDTAASTKHLSQFRSLADKNHPIDVPLEISTELFYTVSVNTLPRHNGTTCVGPNLDRLAASMNNISFKLPPGANILQAYYNNASGVYGDKFPDTPPLKFDFTGNDLPQFLWTPSVDTEVKVLEFGSTVELVLQGTNVLAGTEHPIHLHGHGFYVVGWGFGNFDKDKDPLNYNLVDPPYQNTVTIPKNGWVTVRFTAKNPGVWFMHCHLERHVTWGMAMTFIVKNGNNRDEQMLRPPLDIPKSVASTGKSRVQFESRVLRGAPSIAFPSLAATSSGVLVDLEFQFSPLSDAKEKRSFVPQQPPPSHALRHYTFEVKEASYTKLCRSKIILTVNGQFPGPTLYVTKGETIIDVYKPSEREHHHPLFYHGNSLFKLTSVGRVSGDLAITSQRNSVLTHPHIIVKQASSDMPSVRLARVMNCDDKHLQMLPKSASTTGPGAVQIE
ncbi:laccase-15-like [Prosopis cineraria]|uniref:laccase-15-like n=1 Tax=Prosopis cineraria TaxID=364024 RepID=UPI0024101B35|nr:laccase-15-like [Prosopis cineraria]